MTSPPASAPVQGPLPGTVLPIEASSVDDVTRSMQARVAVERVRFFVAAARLAPVGTEIAAILLLAVYWSAERAHFLAPWFVAISAICLYGHFYLAAAQRRLSGHVGPDVARAAANRAMVLTASAGTLWGAVSGYLFVETDGYIRALTLLAPCLVAVGSVLVFAGAFRVLLGQIVPMLVILAATLAWQASPTHLVMSVGIIVLGTICAITGKYLGDLLTRMLTLNLTNESLLREAAHAKAEIERAHDRYRDVQEAARRQLEQRTKEAEAGEGQKLRFIARASHDLRQPMSALQNFLEVARHWHEQEDHAKVGEILRRATSSVSALSETFSRILDIARYESGEYKPRTQPVDLGQILSDIEEQLGPLAASKGIELRVRRPRQVPVYAETDPEMLWRILSNLAGNAIKFTPPGSAERRSGVLIAAARISDRLRVDICDTGIGVAMEHFASIWEPFYQVGNRERNREKGLGLGLSIVRAACDALGHELVFRSVLGKGSRFSVELPVSPTQPVDTHRPVDGRGAGHVHGVSVVLLEDDRDARESLAALLQTWGVRVLACGSIAEALSRHGEFSASLDAIITDFQLAETETGADAIVVLREQYPHEGVVPAIVVTGNTLGELPGLEFMPKVRVLQKPVKPMRLRRTLIELLYDDFSE